LARHLERGCPFSIRTVDGNIQDKPSWPGTYLCTETNISYFYNGIAHQAGNVL